MEQIPTNIAFSLNGINNKYLLCITRVKDTAIMLFIFSVLLSCSNFEDINSDPNASNKVTPSLLATGLILDVLQSGGDKYFIYDNLLSKQLAWGEGMEAYQYNRFDRDGFGGYIILTNCHKMLQLADNEYKESYEALSLFIKAYKLFYVSMSMGDIPYEDALKGESGGIKPKYNTQKEVMLFVLRDLDTAYNLFSNAKRFAGDPVFDGNIDNWKKVVTAFQLKVMMFLSKKENDPDLKLKERFARIVSSSSLMRSNSDNFQLAYSDKAQQLYPFYETNSKHQGYAMLTYLLVDELKKTGDYRLFYYASPAASTKDEAISSDDWNAYLGVDPSAPFENIKTLFTNGRFSGLNPRYTKQPSGEPLIRIGYSEQNFILAEAVLRGWIHGDAQSYFLKGIKASIDFIAANTPDDSLYHNGRCFTPEVINNFLSCSSIQLGEDREANIEKVLIQKYLASFMQYPYDAYYDYRRTGYPVLPINPATNMNTEKDKIPVRWMYPQSEYSYNKENIEIAVRRQYGGVDDVNKRMWILQ